MKAYTVPAVQSANCAHEVDAIAPIVAAVAVGVISSTAGAVASTVVSKVID